VARHTFATLSLQLGIPIEVVSRLLGHTSLKTTLIYAKVVDEVKVREMKKWD
jgi:site-specific recombinase XerD